MCRHRGQRGHRLALTVGPVRYRAPSAASIGRILIGHLLRRGLGCAAPASANPALEQGFVAARGWIGIATNSGTLRSNYTVITVGYPRQTHFPGIDTRTSRWSKAKKTRSISTAG